MLPLSFTAPQFTLPELSLLHRIFYSCCSHKIWLLLLPRSYLPQSSCEFPQSCPEISTRKWEDVIGVYILNFYLTLGSRLVFNLIIYFWADFTIKKYSGPTCIHILIFVLIWLWSWLLQGIFKVSLSRHLLGLFHWFYQYKGFHFKPRASTTFQRPCKVITIIIHARVPWPFQRMTQGDQVQALRSSASKTSSKCHHATI